jgi:hypothetical protein
LTRQRIQQIAKHAGITWENRRRAILGAGIKQPQSKLIDGGSEVGISSGGPISTGDERSSCGSRQR